MKNWNLLLLGGALFLTNEIIAQDTVRNKEDGGFIFSDVKNVGATEVKNQYRSGTCWSFGTVSFFESELIRSGVKNPNISEMFFVRKAYSLKAEQYVRRQGAAQFGPGGQFHDVLAIIKKYGMLTETSYGGQPIAYGKPVHNELDQMAKAMLDVVVKNPNGKLSPYWKDAYEGMLDAYLGPIPENMKMDGKEMNSQDYAKSVGLNWDDYVELTSYSHEEFYKPFNLQIPDNWMGWNYYNVPIDELVKSAVNAINLGYTIGWDADVSEKGFSFKNGVALLPDVDWAEMQKERRDTIFNSPSPEMEVNQEVRQQMYEDYSTSDDHLMHITGTCKDQNGKLYFIVKNSWGDETNDCGGYIYVSEAYFRAKTVALFVHKGSLEKSLLKKIGF